MAKREHSSLCSIHVLMSLSPYVQRLLGLVVSKMRNVSPPLQTMPCHTHAHLCSFLLWSCSNRDFEAGLDMQVVGRCKVWQATQHEGSAEGKRQAQGRAGGVQWSRHIIWLDGPYSPSLGCCQGVHYHDNRQCFSFFLHTQASPYLLSSLPSSPHLPELQYVKTASPMLATGTCICCVPT